MSKTKKVFKTKNVHHVIKIKLLVITYGLALVVAAIAPHGNITINPLPAPASANQPAPIKSKPLQTETPPPAPEAQPVQPKESPSPVAPKKSPIVKNGRVNYPYYALRTPNDPLSSSSWNHSITGLRTAWDVTTGAPGTIIAVIDTGFAFGHQDLSSQFWTNTGESGSTGSEGPAPNCTSRSLPLDKKCDNIDNDDNGYVDDWRGWDFENGDNSADAGSTNSAHSSASHGTMVSGIIAASGNNGVGVAGAHWNAKIMSLQGLADDGTGYTDSIADAIRYAVDNGAKIINLSLGSDYNDSYLRTAITYAISKNVAVVAAAGNDACDCMLYPANYPEVIAVGATNSSDQRASFSSYGANLDLVAPGSSVCSTTRSSTNQTTQYSCGLQGTSFAAPHVAGAIALLAQKRPGLSPAQIETYLKNSSNRVAAMGGSLFTTQYGYGRLNYYRLLTAAAIPEPQATPFTPPTYSISKSSNDDLSELCQSTATSCNLELTDSEGKTIKTISTATPQSLSGLTVGSWKVLAIDSTTGRAIDPGSDLTITP